MFSRPSAFRSFSLVALGAISLGLRAARAVVSLVVPPPDPEAACRAFVGAEVEGALPPVWLAAARDLTTPPGERVNAPGGAT